MMRISDDEKLSEELGVRLAPKFPGVTVEVGTSDRWERKCVTIRWAGFADLLPEERFHRLATVIPKTFRDQRMRGFVWLELAPEETVDGFLKLPRSEDIADREADIYAGLVKCGFFDALGKTVGPSPEMNCRGAFQQVLKVLSAKKYSPARAHDARLAFIRHGAYCDCQVLLTARPSLDEQHAGAA